MKSKELQGPDTAMVAWCQDQATSSAQGGKLVPMGSRVEGSSSGVSLVRVL